ncbi:hypothetical protein VTJ49DRAFT_2150 [Mycothermus thermophilus]|uniref:Uncharacterized protein n=1 Tax=Humicola insolens TaxID=85995 RepID=A0ABR3VQ96_HUMIN
MAQDVNQKYGAPPRRPPMPTRQPGPTAASAASTKQHWDWAQKAKTKTDNLRAHMDAWERARPQPKPAQPSTRPAPPPREPQPPRTASQARKQEAAFGNRRPGYASASATDDEPPAKNQHYATGPPPAVPPRKSGPAPTPSFADPTPQFSEPFVETNRQRTPYAANVGEKTNLFENVNVNRAKSMRDGIRRTQDATADPPPPTPPHRQRSASTGSDKPPFANPTAQPNFQFPSRASARYSPHGAETNSAPPSASFPDTARPASPASSTHGEYLPTSDGVMCPPVFTDHVLATVNGHSSGPSSGPKVYAIPPISSIRHLDASDAFAKARMPPRQHFPGSGIPVARAVRFDFPAYKSEEGTSPTPSGDGKENSPNSFETKLQAQIQQLLSQYRVSPLKRAASGTGGSDPRKPAPPWPSKYANGTTLSSFSVPMDDDVKAQSRFARNSADNINTRFVGDDGTGAGGFQFSAGAADDSFVRAKQRARGQGSPLRNGFTVPPEPAEEAPQPDAGVKKSDFHPEQWEDLGPEIFVPPQAAKPTVSPTRPLRPIKKPRPVRTATGAAGATDEDEVSGDDKVRESPGPSGTNGSRRSSAMDIDTPPPEPAKPEWRPGNVGGGVPVGGSTGTTPAVPTADPKLGTGLKVPNPKPNTVGSEDMDGFTRPLFAEFRNVEPFAPPKATGLDSFADLSTNLPFPSQASAKIHLDPEKEMTPPRPQRQVMVPSPPQAPRPPVGLCVPSTTKAGGPHPQWAPYAAAFEAYMNEWHAFNRKMTDHFAARQRQMEQRGFQWVNARGDQGVDVYLEALETDKCVRQKWVAACEAHDLHFKEFMGVRQRVLGGLMN